MSDSMPVNPLTAKDLFASAAPIDGTRDRLLWAASNLFYAHGFHAVGLDRILAEVGVTKTTFYNHFESKDELMVEVLKLRDKWETQQLMDMADQLAGGDPGQTLLCLFDAMHVWFNDEKFLGCIFINAAHEFPNPNDPVHQAAAEHKIRVMGLLEELAVKAALREPRELSEQLTILIEGAITLRQVTQNHNAARIARRSAELIVDRHKAA
ncbi:MAG: TetR/AcrR family transcriptional regulator [Phycisphaeraceae bacterium]|nr:TetR/AcrR family transcriptional regulator [Phycisphaeraceae bacterium]